MALLESYLTFNGNCAEAMRFYERTLNGKMQMMMTHGESPMGAQVLAADKNRIMHSRLIIDGGQALMAADSMGVEPPEKMSGFALSLGYNTAADATRTFNALADGGRITMPLAPTFWVETFGMLVDRFGTPWMVGGGPKSF
ncbi:MAG: VOC family protein [Rhizobacter sp.]